MSPATNLQIAPTARVHRDAVIGAGTVIGDFCVIEQDVVIGKGCVLEPYVYIKRWTTLGSVNQISAGTVLGTDPLDKNFKGERSYLQDRQSQPDSRALHHFARHGAGVRDSDRRRQLHHDLRPHRA